MVDSNRDIEQVNCNYRAPDSLAIAEYAKTITESIGLTELLKNLTPMMLETSGAERFVLLLPDEAQNWHVRVSAHAEEINLLNQPLVDEQNLPTELIQSVASSQTTWKDSDTQQPIITNEYFNKPARKSAFCLPMTHHSKTVGVIYMDHGKQDGLFTGDRIKVLKFLGAQAAIAIENTQLTEAFKQKPKTQDTKHKEADFFQTTAENLPGFMYRIKITPDNELIVLFVTANCEVVYEVSAESMMNGQYSFSDFVHQEDRERVESRRSKKGRRAGSEFRIVTASGIVKWLSVSGHPKSCLPDGSIIYDGIALDITDRKAVELELQLAQSQLQTVTENTPGMVFRYVVRSDGNKTVLYISPQVHQLFELEVEEVLVNIDLVNSRIHPEDIELIQLELQESLNRSGPTQLEYRVVLPEQGIRWRRSVRRASRSEEGSIIWDGVVIDVTDHKTAELALRESEKKFQRMIKNIPGVVYRSISHPDGTREFIHVSSESKVMFGATPEEILKDATKITNWIHPEDHKRLIEQRQNPDTQSTRQSLEFRVQWQDKETRWYECFRQPEYLLNGDVIWDGVVLDVSDRKEAQAQLERVTKNGPGMVFRFVEHADGSRAALFVSHHVRELYEVEIEDVLADISNARRRVHPDDRDLVEKRIRDSVNQAGPLRLEYRVILPKRGMRWLQAIGQTSRGDEGDTFWDGVVIDVTDQKNAELALRESENKFQRIAENVPGMVYRFVIRADGRREFTYVSSQCRELYEVEPEVALKDAEPLFARCHPDDVRLVETAIKQLVSQLNQLDIEHRVVLPKRGLRWLKTSNYAIRNEEGDTLIDGVVFDSTHHKHAEQHLQQANEELVRATKMKDEFLANMSHELRTPLSAILGSAEGLKHGIFGEVREQQTESVNVIHDSGIHLLDLINEVLDLAKIESGSFQLDLSEINIKHICESSMQMVNQQALKKNISTALRLPDRLPLLQADKMRVRQILVNLLSNAVKYTPEHGQVRLSLEHVKTTNVTAHELVRFSIEDTGIGIEESEIDSVFEPFVQVQTSLSREYGGTGLGLALVKQFTELHRGRVYARSQLGNGSCFYVELPIHQKSFETPALPLSDRDEHTQNDKSAADQNPLILLAEDNEAVAKTTTRYLKLKSMRVHLVTDGEAAVKAAQKLKPDVILMDIQMPRVDGLAAIKQLRKIEALKETPIIALTGLAMRDDAKRCLAAGADKYLSKPYPMQDLIDLVQQLLQREEA